MRIVLLTFLALLLASCQNPPPKIPLAPTFTRFQPIYLDVSKIEIVDEYKPPMKAPYVDHLIPYSPTDAMHVWARDRLRGAGLDKTMQLIIHDGSVIATELPVPGGVEGFLTVHMNKRYDSKLDVELRIYGGGAMSEANIKATVTRSFTMREDASIADREAAFRNMTFDMMETMNAELEKDIFMYFGKYIAYAHTP